MGRPLKFKNEKELQYKIAAYFKDCDPHWEEVEEWKDEKDSSGRLVIVDGVVVQNLVKRKKLTKQKPYTITGLAMYLGTTRETLLEYEGEVEGREKSKEFADTIKEAKVKIHNWVEGRLYDGNAAGPIFNLKNNFNWKDRQEIDHTVQRPILGDTDVPIDSSTAQDQSTGQTDTDSPGGNLGGENDSDSPATDSDSPEASE